MKNSIYPVSFVQAELINPLLNEINAYTGRTLSVSTVSKALIHLKDCMNQAVEDGFIQRNPCKGIKIGKNASTTHTDEMRFFNDDEILRFTQAARATTVNGFPIYKYGEILVLDIYTGLRSGEFLALKKKDVELDKRRIKVHSGLVHYYNLDEDSPTYKTYGTLTVIFGENLQKNTHF